jgi:hypothetical protein
VASCAEGDVRDDGQCLEALAGSPQVVQCPGHVRVIAFVRRIEEDKPRDVGRKPRGVVTRVETSERVADEHDGSFPRISRRSGEGLFARSPPTSGRHCKMTDSGYCRCHQRNRRRLSRSFDWVGTVFTSYVLLQRGSRATIIDACGERSA